MTVPVPEVRDGGGGALGAAVAALWDLTHVLRAQCPWDIEQTAGSIVPHTLEEAWEVADEVRRVERAIAAGDDPSLAGLADELGDLLFQVCFLAMWCEERDASVDLASVARGIFGKLVRRHPHVFGTVDDVPTSADDVLVHWNRVKREQESRGLFDGIPRAMPAVARARKVQSRAAQVGFDFASARDAVEKLEEEVGELRRALERAPSVGVVADPAVEAELGDVLFAAANVARLARVEPELAVSDSTERFQARVSCAMSLAHEAGDDFAELDLDAQEAWYQRAKAQLSARDS